MTTANVRRVLEAAGFKESETHALGKTAATGRSRGFQLKSMWRPDTLRADPRVGITVRLHANTSSRSYNAPDESKVMAALAARFERVELNQSGDVEVLGPLGAATASERGRST